MTKFFATNSFATKFLSTKLFASHDLQALGAVALGLERNPLSGELLALEPRMVFDGAALPTAAALGTLPASDHPDAAADADAAAKAAAAAEAAAKAAAAAAAEAAAARPVPPATPVPHEVVFIDSRVQDIDAFRQSVPATTTIVIVDAEEDGITKITDTLKTMHDVSAIHIIGHGVEGAFELGRDWIGLDTIKAHESDLENWKQALTSDADILLYGCDVAKGDDGQALIAEIAKDSGADVAASADPTGLTDHGVDWSLDKSTAGGFFALILFICPLPTTIPIPAVASARLDAMIFPRSSARVVEIFVSEGQTVNTGDALIRLEAPDLDAQIHYARAQSS